MSSEEPVHGSLMKVMPTSGKGTLGTWRFLRRARARLDKTEHLTVARARNEVVRKPFTAGAYAYQRLNLVADGKAHRRKAKASNRT
jgi:hypothetical protein